MKKKIFIKNKQLLIKNLKLKDCNQSYLRWLNDSNINKFLEIRFNKKQTLKNIKDNLIKINKSKNNFLLGIFLRKNKKHVGNIKIGNIDYNNKTAEIGFLIGEKNFHKKNIATQSVKLVTNFCFKTLKLRYVFGQVIENNIASKKVFEKNKFFKAGYFKKKAVYLNKRINIIYYEKKI